jgi:predicted lipoprotein
MKKPIKYSLWALAILLILFLSLDIRKLEEVRANSKTEVFDATAYAREFFENKLPTVIENAPEINLLIELLKTEPQQAFENYGQKLGISKTWYFLVKGEGVIESGEEENLRVNIDQSFQTRIATSFIFGNAIRDGSGAVDIDEFLNMTDFNNVSIAINAIIKNEVVPPVRKIAEPGMKLEFAGAFEINEDEIDVQYIRIIPVSVKLSNGNRE